MGCCFSSSKTLANPEKADQYLGLLKDIPFLQDLEDDELLALSALVEQRTYAPGEFLMKQGEEGKEFFIISDGLCEVCGRDFHSQIQLHSGDYCGEQSLLKEHEPRNASVKAITQTTCLILGVEEFRMLKSKQIRFVERNTERHAIIATQHEPAKQIDRESVRKTEVVQKWLMERVQGHILFDNLTYLQRSLIVGPMYQVSVNDGEELISQGDVGDEFYVCESGAFDVFVNEKLVTRFKRGACFGELALMYDCPRQATVKATEASVVWTVQRPVFRQAITGIYKEKNHKRLDVLREIDIFSALLKYELSLIADTCSEHSYTKGTVILNQGDVGDRFYMIAEGTASFTIKKDGDRDVFGDITNRYFGELALMNRHSTEGEARRKATVVAKTDLITYELVRKDFVNLLGPVENIMMERAKVYDEITHGKIATPSDEKKASSLCTLDELKFLGVLGKGAFGVVMLTKDPHTQKTYALKAILKELIIQKNQESVVLREKKIMEKLHHPRLVHLYGTMKDEYRIYFVLGVCLGGELFTLLRKKRYFSERVSKFYSACVIEGFEYMHSKDIIYRDLKPENLVIDSGGYIKITDFGFATHIDDKTFTLCGTPEYLAPEIVTGQGHGKGADWWTLGVFIYEMLASISPFYSSDPLSMYKNIVRGVYKTPKYFTAEAADIVTSLLHRKPTKRLGVIKGGAKLIKKHPWFDGPNGLDWKALAKNDIKPPWVPKIKSNEDSTNFRNLNFKPQDNVKKLKLKHEDEF